MHRNTCISSGALRLASLCVTGATSSIDIEGKSGMDLTSGSAYIGRGNKNNGVEEGEQKFKSPSYNCWSKVIV